MPDDKQIFTDRELMLHAIELARNCKNEKETPSPKVGAVVARDGRIIGSAFRGELAPGDHAEFTLLEKKLHEEELAGASLFATLEPCSKRSPEKTPCADWAIQRRLGKVVYGTLDRNPDILGRGETKLIDAGIRIGRFDDDLIPVIEEMNRAWIRYMQLKRERSDEETREPFGDEVGINGFRIGYNEDGDKVEWIEEDGEVWPMILRRNDKSILEELGEISDKVWYNRKLVMFDNMENGREERKPEHESFIAKALEKMKEMEEKYGVENLTWNDFEWGFLQGKMSALNWVLGSDWESSLDT